ncbi:sucrase ferredoxin [Streptomyces sp. BB1-1-1]|uniref:sucrase ferredoxin n=1 Tax=Streptomyces sp. BB1-1-1 TaxID=3074430 RepID=UPI002877E59D|nr:sucrase ferredoxin [Streptomyces sp. BB1-1-1]WND34638.1 sucrase ferredoxin [Streptomyces sp. BB1-1-1]
MSTCSTVSRNLDEPVSGTAPVARTWLLLEQPGPWGAKALTSSHLDPALGRALEAAVKGTGVRIALIRRPGRHADADRGAPAERRVYVAHTVPGNVWLHTTTLTDPRRLLALDFAALGRGDRRAFDSALEGAPHPGAPLALVCTNGKRDRCCALLGRPLAAELAASGAEGVWEVTHLGGHRFSPAVLVLPHGYAYARVQAHTVKEILHGAARGRIVVEGCRGNSAWERPGQAAELAVRAAVNEDAAQALNVVRTDGAAPRWEVTLAHADGRHWRVTVTQGASAPPRPESCGASVLGSPARMEVTAVRELSVTAALAS